MRSKECLFIVLVICFSAFTVNAEPDSLAAKSQDTTLKTVTAGKYTMTYQVDGKNLVATVSCQTKGWVAVGFGPKNVMQDANFIIGTVINGKAVVTDEFGDGMFSHRPDTALGGKNDIIAGDCKQANGVTTLSFTIPLDSGDPKDVALVPGQKVKVIFSTGETNDTGKKHKTTAKTVITLPR
jgi:hypothetical protein